MWECQKCHERHEDSFEVCWKCGTSRSGVEDPSFQPADDVDAASLVDPAEDNAIAAGPPPPRTTFGKEPGYEFSPEQNEVIAALASSMKFVGVISLLGGALLLVAGNVFLAKGDFSVFVQAVLALIIGGLTVHAAGAFRRIVDSRGNDIGHLMTALGALRMLYRLQVFLICIALGLVLLLLAGGLGR